MQQISNLTLRQRLMPQGLPFALAGTSVRHWGNSPEILTRLTLDAEITVGDDGNLRVGMKVFSPGVGAVVTEAELRVVLEHLDVAGTSAVGVMGLGTELASGANATLAVGATQNLVASTATLAMDGAAPTVVPSRNLAQLIGADGIFLNLADDWPDVTDPTVHVTGEIWLRWRRPNV